MAQQQVEIMKTLGHNKKTTAVSKQKQYANGLIDSDGHYENLW